MTLDGDGIFSRSKHSIQKFSNLRPSRELLSASMQNFETDSRAGATRDVEEVRALPS